MQVKLLQGLAELTSDVSGLSREALLVSSCRNRGASIKWSLTIGDLLVQILQNESSDHKNYQFILKLTDNHDISWAKTNV